MGAVYDPIRRLESTARRLRTDAGGVGLAWRSWGAGPPLLLLHGDFGCWLHWLANIDALSARHRVLAVDMPGYGDSAMSAPPHDPAHLAGCLDAAVGQLLGPAHRFALAGFSYGAVVGCHLAARCGDRLRRLVLAGPGGFGRPGPTAQRSTLRRSTAGMSPSEKDAVRRHNLNALMIADPSCIDDLALRIDREGARHARMRAGGWPASDTLLRTLPDVRAPLHVIYGERDAFVTDGLDARAAALRRLRPSVDFRTVPNAGHWVVYEAAAAVNAMLLEMFRPEAV